MPSIIKIQRVVLLLALLATPAFAQDVAGDPGPKTGLTAPQLATDLGQRLDALQHLLDAVRDARGEPIRQQAMERHWQAMQDYMAASLKIAVRDADPVADVTGCRAIGGGSWTGLSFPGQARSDDYLRDMQAHMGRMRSDLLAVHDAREADALDAALRAHWRSNYEFLQSMRGQGWMFVGWTPGVPGDQALPEPESEGAQLTRSYCSICHAVPQVRLHTAAEWTPIITQMDRHIALSDSGLPMCVQMPTAQEIGAIRAYFAKHAR